MNKNTILSEDELTKIETSYSFECKDEFMTKRLANIENNIPWKHVKNNTKKNRFRKQDDKILLKPDPYKFVEIPKNMKEIITNLCNKNDITIQLLAVKCNLPLHIIDNYMTKNNNLDNYYLQIILKNLNFDLLEYIESQKKTSD